MTHSTPMTLVLACVLPVALLEGCTSVATERPSFTLVKQYGSFAVREYPQLLVAEVTVQGTRDEASSAGFRLLANYIFGGNQGARSIAMTAPVTQSAGQKIAMTAPVTQVEQGSSEWLVQFTMPATFTSLEQLPQPNDARVKLRAVPRRSIAVVAYSGTWSEALYARQLAALEQGVREAGLTTKGPPLFARYDPPWKPWFLRTNEIQLEVEVPGTP